MATSNSINFNLTANEVISEMLEQLGVIPTGGTVRAEDYNSCLRTLNLMIKAWQSRGVYLWAEEEAYLFLDTTTASYNLGGTSPSRAVSAYISTTLSAAEASGQTTLSVTSSTGMAALDVVGIELDDGTMHWTTISSVPDSTSIIINVALTDDAASGSTVYTYDPDDVISRPLEVTSVRVRTSQTNTSDVKIYPISKKVYYNLPNKGSSGQPIQYYVDKRRDFTRLFLYPVPSTVDHVVHFSYRRILEDLDSSTDDLDFPQEALLAIVFNGCLHVCNKYGKSQNVSEMISGAPSISSMAQAYFKLLEDNNQERASVRIRPWIPE